MLHLPALLNADELRQARQCLDTARWVDGRTTAGPQAATVKNNEQLAPDSAEARELQALVLGALDRSPLFFSAALPKRVLPPAFNRYGGASNAYGNHVDQAIRRHPRNGQAIRTDLSCTVFLSEPGEYDGGELVIEDAYGSTGERRAKFAAGDGVLYGGTSVHRVEPVERGVRRAAFFWIESLVRSEEQRRLLFEMDAALMRLRRNQGENPEAVALTGTYHNLLRMWSDT